MPVTLNTFLSKFATDRIATIGNRQINVISIKSDFPADLQTMIERPQGADRVDREFGPLGK